MDKDNILVAMWCIFGIIVFLLAIFIGQTVANALHLTGIMWWIVAIIAYVISGLFMGLIAREVIFYIDDHFI